MRCPYCGVNKDRVIDSRTVEEGRTIRRRRECNGCGKRFTTYEHVEERSRLMVVKKDGTRVPYDRAKAMTGLERSCYKRPISIDELQQLMDEVEEQIFRKHDREVESIEIGKAIADKLKRVDQVAYVRFASVYKQFRDLDDLLEEVREVIESTGEDSPSDQGMLF